MVKAKTVTSPDGGSMYAEEILKTIYMKKEEDKET